ncbi:MAG: hypothetical protein Q7P63_15405 [Verrucomicrobiota bacterium JB022]|nr:hypothetical protein [Verrucomicrobiota bacterium JB022]
MIRPYFTRTCGALLLLGAAALPASVSAQATVSGSLSFDYNTHFISYGADVWGTGDDLDEPTFNPSVGVTLDFGNGFGVYTGAWMDVNNKAPSDIGGTLQELDVWVGGYATFGIVTLDAAVQQWIYGGDVEEIFDFAVSLDTTDMIGFNLSPTVKMHHRFEGNGDQITGTILDFSVGYDLEINESFSLSFPVAVGWVLDEGYYTATDDSTDPATTIEGDSGIGYYMAGIGFSYALPFGEAAGSWDLHGGVNYYYTPDDVIPGNPEEGFVTASLGVGLSW